jgi:hypothetical protein
MLTAMTGFGQQMSWDQDSIIPKGHQMSMRDALHIVSIGTLSKVMLPDWSLKLTKHLQSIKIAYEELRVQKFQRISRAAINEALSL